MVAKVNSPSGLGKFASSAIPVRILLKIFISQRRRQASHTALPLARTQVNLLRTMARPAISDERVINEGPQSIRVKLKSRWTDRTESLLTLNLQPLADMKKVT
ncbi:MAG: hypothetical protein RL189_2348 [Pseudomonadota bacterium]|jgi:hypothetical protein